MIEWPFFFKNNQKLKLCPSSAFVFLLEVFPGALKTTKTRQYLPTNIHRIKSIIYCIIWFNSIVCIRIQVLFGFGQWLVTSLIFHRVNSYKTIWINDFFKFIEWVICTVYFNFSEVQNVLFTPLDGAGIV